MIRIMSILAFLMFSSTVHCAPYLIHIEGIVNSILGADASSKASVGESVEYRFTIDLDRIGEATNGVEFQYYEDDYFAELIDSPGFKGEEDYYSGIESLNYASDINGNRSEFTIGNLLKIFIYAYTPDELIEAAPGALEDNSYIWDAWQVEGQTNSVRSSNIEIISITQVPLPPTALMLLSSLSLLFIKKLKGNSQC